MQQSLKSYATDSIIQAAASRWDNRSRHIKPTQ
jgi:hypothetical protein